MVELGRRGAAADGGRDGGGEEGCKWRAGGPRAGCTARARSGERGPGGGAEALWERAGDAARGWREGPAWPGDASGKAAANLEHGSAPRGPPGRG